MSTIDQLLAAEATIRAARVTVNQLEAGDRVLFHRALPGEVDCTVTTTGTVVESVNTSTPDVGERWLSWRTVILQDDGATHTFCSSSRFVVLRAHPACAIPGCDEAPVGLVIDPGGETDLSVGGRLCELHRQCAEHYGARTRFLVNLSPQEEDELASLTTQFSCSGRGTELADRIDELTLKARCLTQVFALQVTVQVDPDVIRLTADTLQSYVDEILETPESPQDSPKAGYWLVSAAVVAGPTTTR